MINYFTFWTADKQTTQRNRDWIFGLCGHIWSHRASLVKSCFNYSCSKLSGKTDQLNGCENNIKLKDLKSSSVV